MKQTLLFFSFILILNSRSIAQGKTVASEHGHKFTLVLSHAHVSKGYNSGTGNQQWLILPAWCLDYDYIINPKWQIGLHNDIITETYEVESFDDVILKRTRPITCTVVGGYQFANRWTFLAGSGGEFAEEHNFFLTTFGIEYAYELPDDFEVMGMVNYDIKWNAYDTFLIGLGISKTLK